MAAYWWVAGAADLVGKHHFADTHWIKDWPKAWEAWAHADEAAFQLKNMKASGVPASFGRRQKRRRPRPHRDAIKRRWLAIKRATELVFRVIVGLGRFPSGLYVALVDRAEVPRLCKSVQLRHQTTPGSLRLAAAENLLIFRHAIAPRIP